MKYSLTKNTKQLGNITLYQIKAEKSFGNVSKGDLGGWIEKKENLSEEDDAWVSDNALVFGDAWVSGDARVSGDAWVSDNALVFGDARISGDARVYGDARISGDAFVFGDASVYGDASVSGKLSLTSGYFFGYKEKTEDLKYFSIDDNYELIGKGNCKVEEQNNQKAQLLKKAQELIDKAEELKKEANKL